MCVCVPTKVQAAEGRVYKRWLAIERDTMTMILTKRRQRRRLKKLRVGFSLSSSSGGGGVEMYSCVRSFASQHTFFSLTAACRLTTTQLARNVRDNCRPAFGRKFRAAAALATLHERSRLYIPPAASLLICLRSKKDFKCFSQANTTLFSLICF